jgi:hypothetical protein
LGRRYAAPRLITTLMNGERWTTWRPRIGLAITNW